MDYEPRRLTPRRRQHWGVEPDPELEAQLDDESGVYEVVNRRRILWRDSAFILIGVVIALLVAQTLLPRSAGTVTGEPSDFSTGVALGSIGSPRTLAPGETVGPIIDPSLGIDATPTPIPVITLAPTRKPDPIATPTPTPTVTPAPTATPRITPRPTTTPRPTRTPTPTGTPTPTQTPAPTADFTWNQSGLTTVVDFTDGSSGSVVTWSWEFEGGGSSSQPNPSHDFGLPGVYSVTLTVTGPGGSSSITKPVTVL